MSWEAIGAIAESLGTLAVLISLIYLAIQIRNQNKESQLSATRDLSRGFTDFTGEMAGNSDLAAILVKGNHGLESLDEVESLQFFSHNARVCRILEGLYRQNSAGRLHDDSWSGVKNILIDYSAYKGFRDWWHLRRHWYSKEFQDYIDPIMREKDGRENT